MTGKELVKQLKKQGWELSRITGSHHIIAKGKKTVSIPVHKNKGLGKGLLNKILKEVNSK